MCVLGNQQQNDPCSCFLLLRFNRCCWTTSLHNSHGGHLHSEPSQGTHVVSADGSILCPPCLVLTSLLAFTRVSFLSLPLTSSFNRLDLPPYESYDKLYEKLTCAIENTEGFHVEWSLLPAFYVSSMCVFVCMITYLHYWQHCSHTSSTAINFYFHCNPAGCYYW